MHLVTIVPELTNSISKKLQSRTEKEMNPTSSYTFTSCQTECAYVDSQSYMRYSGNLANHPFGTNTPCRRVETAPSSATIHINPRHRAPRSIYINKALYSIPSFKQDVTSSSRKIERIYYNPKFLKSTPSLTNSAPSSLCTTAVPHKQEANIHINPNFIRKEGNQRQKPGVFHEQDGLDKPVVSSGIHVNPMFLKGIRAENTSENIDPVIIAEPTGHQNLQLDCGVPTVAAPRQKYITKYKIVSKKVLSAVNNDSSSFIKSNLKKINQTPSRKCKFKIVKGKCLKYVSQSIADQTFNYSNKYSFKRNCSKSKIASLNACKSYFSQAVPNIPSRFKQLHNGSKSSLSLSYRKSILQQKIEARRRVKSSINQSLFKNLSLRSKYKYVRSPQCLKQFRPTQKNPFTKDYYKSNFKTSNEVAQSSARLLSEFKSIGRTKLVRKSVLQKQIESRMRTRKSLLSSNISPRKKIGDKVSKYKIIRRVDSLQTKKSPLPNKITSLNKKVSRKKRSLLVYSSDKYRSEKQKKVAILTKKLRKNNQPCPFYSRFGRCKGKERGTCTKLHDPKYITICKRYLKGDCKEEKCLLSHDIRPEKMPTCHHYLAGLCKRTDCPYLHIKVNQKAPICRSFLQGFCADVFNCTKRHEYICPAFAEKGSCPRGKSCSLPHRTGVTCSKLLEPDEFPLLCRKRREKPRRTKVSIPNKSISVDSTQNGGESESTESAKEVKPKEFKRYFLALPPDEASENSDSEN